MIYFNNFNKDEMDTIRRIFNYHRNINDQNSDFEKNNTIDRVEKIIKKKDMLNKNDFYTITLMFTTYLYMYKYINTFNKDDINYIANLILKFIFFYKGYDFYIIKDMDIFIVDNLKKSFNKYNDILIVQKEYISIYHEIID